MAIFKKTGSFLKWLFINKEFLIGCSIFSTLFSVYISWKMHNWAWFGRFGSILALLGGVLATRRLIRRGVAGINYDESHINGGNLTDEPGLGPEEIKDIEAARWGFWFIFLGTIIWGFGDLFNLFYNL